MLENTGEGRTKVKERAATAVPSTWKSKKLPATCQFPCGLRVNGPVNKSPPLQDLGKGVSTMAFVRGFSVLLEP